LPTSSAFHAPSADLTLRIVAESRVCARLAGWPEVPGSGSAADRVHAVRGGCGPVGSGPGSACVSVLWGLHPRMPGPWRLRKVEVAGRHRGSLGAGRLHSRWEREDDPGAVVCAPSAPGRGGTRS